MFFLLSLVSACGTYQTTRLRATAGGVDMARLLAIQSTDDATVSIDPAQQSVVDCIEECDATDIACLARCNPVPRSS